ncbi:MAG: IscA/HesB family protein [Proteobacteria bacterium]|nr:IscA/HesB family protein [Pseudomonadota bacterium]
MFNVSEKAQEQIKIYFKGKELMPVRVFLHKGGCGGPQIAMALDEKKESDTIFTIEDIEYLVDSEFLKEAQPIGVDFIESGFKVTSRLELSSGCSSCGTEGSCCS